MIALLALAFCTVPTPDDGSPMGSGMDSPEASEGEGPMAPRHPKPPPSGDAPGKSGLLMSYRGKTLRKGMSSRPVNPKRLPAVYVLSPRVFVLVLSGTN